VTSCNGDAAQRGYGQCAVSRRATKGIGVGGLSWAGGAVGSGDPLDGVVVALLRDLEEAHVQPRRREHRHLQHPPPAPSLPTERGAGGEGGAVLPALVTEPVLPTIPPPTASSAPLYFTPSTFLSLPSQPRHARPPLYSIATAAGRTWYSMEMGGRDHAFFSSILRSRAHAGPPSAGGAMRAAVKGVAGTEPADGTHVPRPQLALSPHIARARARTAMAAAPGGHLHLAAERVLGVAGELADPPHLPPPTPTNPHQQRHTHIRLRRGTQVPPGHMTKHISGAAPNPSARLPGRAQLAAARPVGLGGHGAGSCVKGRTAMAGPPVRRAGREARAMGGAEGRAGRRAGGRAGREEGWWGGHA
jgi:hypothetical protein